MRICHVQSLFSPEHGGPTHSLTNYCRAQVAAGHEVTLVVMEGHPGSSPAVRLPPPIRQEVLPIAGPAKLGRCPALLETLRRLPRPDVLHVHGSWHVALSDAVKYAKAQGIPVMLELMGSYSAYELERKPVRKWLARKIYQDAAIAAADCIHANSETEARYMRSLGFKNPVAVISVGVPMPESVPAGAGAEIIPIEWAGRRWLLYLARIHPTKGVDLLLQAWRTVLGQRDDWRLLIAGHGEAGWVDAMRREAGNLGLSAQCRFAGPIGEAQKAWAYSHAHAYILPSRQENFGNTVAEALAHGCPAGTTTGTPWGLLENEQCGWIEAPTPAGIEQLLRRMTATSETEAREMGARGRRLVQDRFSMSAVQDDMAGTYRWLLGGAVPRCVLLPA